MTPHRPGPPGQPLWRRRRRGDRGAASVELVIATPLVALLLLTVVQFGVWAHAQHIAQAAANTGLQEARAYNSTAAAGDAATRQVLDQAGGSILSNASISVTRGATTATVTITAAAAPVLPGVALPVHVSVTGPVERVVGAGPVPTVDERRWFG